MLQFIQHTIDNIANGNPFLAAVLQTIMVPLCIFALGRLIDFITTVFIRYSTFFVGRSTAGFVVNRIFFIGTIHHELAHALFAFITGAKVIRIVPIRFKGRELGHVDFRPRGNIVFRSIQQSMSAIAPVVCGSISLFLLYNYLLPLCTVVWQRLIVEYMELSILLHMNMSSQDVKVAFKGLPVCMVVMFIFFVIYDLWTMV